MNTPTVLTHSSPCQVLLEDPELGDALSWPERRQAIDGCSARTVRVPRGRWTVDWNIDLQAGIGLLVLDGLLLCRVGIDGRFGAELLGEGDLLRPWESEDSALFQTTGWRVLEPARLAVLDMEVARRMAAYPELTGRLVGRALQRARNLTVNMAIVQHARVSERLLMLLWHLADRWGRVGTEGVILPLHLTHSVLADLVAARRPTVTTALTDLARQRLVHAVGHGWLLFGGPPGALREFQQAVTPMAPERFFAMPQAGGRGRA